MKFGIISDLHLDHSPWKEAPSGEYSIDLDLLVIAGDSFASKNIDYHRTLFDNLSRSVPDIIIISGNHEFYGSTFTRTFDEIRTFFASYNNIHFAENEVLIFQGVPFVCTSLWTNNNNSNRVTRDHLLENINDYKMIRLSSQRNLDPNFVAEYHERCLRFIDDSYDHLQKSFGKMVVVTHHAPSVKSVSQYYKSTEFDRQTNYSYYSDLESFIENRPKIAAWVHGHMHEEVDYMIGNTRIVTNPRGYLGYDIPKDAEVHPKIVEV